MSGSHLRRGDSVRLESGRNYSGQGGVGSDEGCGGLRDASPVNDTLHQFRVFPGLAQVECGFQFFLQDELVLGQLLLQVSEIDC